jgi:hypothetical protein
MKTTLLRKKLLNGCAFILMVVIVCSCSNALFDQPQPVNAKNLKKIPKELHGRWINDFDTIIIDKSSYTHISVYEDHITKAEVDKSKDFKMVNDKLCPTNEDANVKDFKYTLKNDTFFYAVRYIANLFCLSDSVLLRKTKETYVCNVKKGNWWELYVIQKGKNGEIKIYCPDGNIIKENQLKYGISLIDTVKVKTEDEFYFKASLNPDFFEKNINDKVFSLYFTLFPNSTFDTEN